MERSPWFWGIAGGVVSAVLFLSVLTNTSFLLFQYLAHLPLFAVGLAFGLWAVVIAGLTGSAISLVVDGVPGLVFIVVYALPVILLVRFALLSRAVAESGSGPAPGGTVDARADDQSGAAPGDADPGETDPGETGDGGPAPAAGGAVEWYPTGRLLALATAYGLAVMVLAELVLVGEGGLQAVIQQALAEFFEMMGDQVPPTAGTNIQNYGFLLPGMLGFSWLLVLLVNGIGAQSLLRSLGRNIRPSPVYHRLVLPAWLVYGLVAVAVLTLVTSGSFAFLASAALILIASPFLLQGLAVVHTVMPRTPGRPIFLGIFYAVLILTFWLVLPVITLGVMEHWLRIRDRWAARV